MSRLPKAQTLAEHDAWLREQGLYDEMVRRHERLTHERERGAAELRKAETPLLRDLHAAGYGLTSVWDLVNTAAPYSDALPILLNNLERSYPVPIREGIARALAVRDARFAWPTGSCDSSRLNPASGSRTASLAPLR